MCWNLCEGTSSEHIDQAASQPRNPSLSIDNSFENNIGSKLNTMLPELNIDTHKPKNLSQHNKSSSTPVDGIPKSNSTKTGATSFQLFGCTIQTDQASDKIIDDDSNVGGEDNKQ
ncbi:Auxin response factor [Arachis hypogaea]|nr:Auxin response factor [Arachis hypogaea]